MARIDPHSCRIEEFIQTEGYNGFATRRLIAEKKNLRKTTGKARGFESTLT